MSNLPEHLSNLHTTEQRTTEKGHGSKRSHGLVCVLCFGGNSAYLAFCKVMPVLLYLLGNRQCKGESAPFAGPTLYPDSAAMRPDNLLSNG